MVVTVSEIKVVVVQIVWDCIVLIIAITVMVVGWVRSVVVLINSNVVLALIFVVVVVVMVVVVIIIIIVMVVRMVVSSVLTIVIIVMIIGRFRHVIVRIVWRLVVVIIVVAIVVLNWLVIKDWIGLESLILHLIQEKLSCKGISLGLDLCARVEAFSRC